MYTSYLEFIAEATENFRIFRVLSENRFVSL